MGTVECDKCGKSFTSEDALEQHLEDYDHSKVMTCSDCGEHFTDEDAYEDHRRTHMHPLRQKASAITVTHLVLGILLVGTSGLVYYGATSTATDTGSTADTTASTVNQTVTVSGGEYYFSPRRISVTRGERVRVTFRNTGSIPHNLRIPSLGVGSNTINPGRSSSFTFTAPKSGTFPITFECTLPGHARNGMRGTVTVSDSS
ncbi:MAG: cupredoxin domain-containing protein [Candidatus Nanohaloarchaea archaeon]|nr:cupredoxin domain-containing protein [Candidatus Nanohaloarchaea archaeon]